MLLKKQRWVSPQRGLPIDNKDASASIASQSGETVQLYYYNSGTQTIDAGQAAGVSVVGKFSYNNIKNELGTMEGSLSDTSLSFTSTALTSEVDFDYELAERYDDQPAAIRCAKITENFSNGDYCVDYSNGIIYGKKASTQVTLTSTAYKYSAASVGSVAIDEFPEAAALEDGSADPTTTSVGSYMMGYNGSTWDRIRTAITTATSTFTGILNVLGLGKYNATEPTLTDGQGIVTQMDENGYTKVRSKGYSATYDAEKTLPQRDDSDNVNGDTLADITNEADATSNYYWDVELLSTVVVGCIKNGSSTDTLTANIKATNQNDGTAASSCSYGSITQYGLDRLTGADPSGATVALADNTLELFEINTKGLKYINVEIVSSDTANDADYTVWAQGQY